MVSALATLAFACFCVPAHASGTITYAADLRSAEGSAGAGGRVELQGVSTGVSLRVEIGPPAAPAIFSATEPVPSQTYASPYVTGIGPGDEIRVWQPADASAPTDVLRVAAPEVDAGITTTVFVPTGMTGELITDGACGRESSDVAGLPEGESAVPHPSFTPGSFQTLIVTDALGNSTSLTDAAPGETPCFQVNASSAPRSFKVAATHLTGTTIEASHLVLTRGTDVLMDAGGDGTGVAGVPDATPQPGDVLTLDTPSHNYSVVLPEVGAAHDPAAGLVQVDAPAAGRLSAEVLDGGFNIRSARDTDSGETDFDFASPQGSFGPFDLATAAGVAVTYNSPGYDLEYLVDSAAPLPTGPTDSGPTTTDPPVEPVSTPVEAKAVRPKVKLALPAEIDVSRLGSKLGRGLKLSFTCAAPARYTFLLAFPSQGRASSKVLATANGSVKAGKRTAKLKFTRAGVKAMRSLKRSRRAVLTIQTRTATGLTSMTTRSTKIVP